MIPTRFLIGLGGVILFAIVYIIVMATVQPAPEPEALNRYCEEAIEGGIVKEPNNFFTDLGFVVVGLAILLWLDLSRNHLSRNPMVRGGFYSTMYGYLTLWLGPGSMLEHGTLTAVGGWADPASIQWYGLFVIAYVILRATDPKGIAAYRPEVLAIFVAAFLVSAAALGFVSWFSPDSRQWISIVLLGGVILALVLHAGLQPTGADWRVLLFAGGFFIAGFLFWLFDQFRWIGCPETHLYQHHGIWHLCMAVTTLFIYIYFRSGGDPASRIR